MMTLPPLPRILRLLPALLGAGIAMVVYWMTMLPTVGYIDSGELSAVACTLGIAHPSGYPLFTILGWIFAHLPIGTEEIIRLNLMAGVFCAAGVFMFFHLVTLALGLLSERQDKRRGWLVAEGPGVVPVASFGASMILAFSETWWSQAVAVEVYSLHVLLLVTTIYAFLRAQSSRNNTWWLLFAFTLGLGFTNHMTTILLAPGFLYYYFAVQGWRRDTWMRIARMIPPFLLGLSVYLYLPLRAAQGPALSWGNPVTWERFLWHLSGKQYRVWLFSSTEATGRQFRYFFESLPGELAYVGLILGLIGFVIMFRLRRRLWVWSILLFVACVAYSINYDIHDIDSYFLLAYVVVALWSGVGLWWVGSVVIHSWRWRKWVVAGILCMVSFIPLQFHWAKVDQRATYDVEDYTRNVFACLDRNALVLSYQWDFWVSASQYYQLVRGVRTDVTVVDKELLRRSWYLTQLERTSPWLIEASRTEVDAFLRELYRFEHDLPYNPNIIEGRFVEMIRSFVRTSMTTRPVYVTPEIEPEFAEGYQRVPVGLAFRLVADSLFHPTAFPELSARAIRGEGRLAGVMKRLYGEAFSTRAEYFLQHGEQTEAIRCYQEALRRDPTSVLAKSRLQMLGRFR